MGICVIFEGELASPGAAADAVTAPIVDSNSNRRSQLERMFAASPARGNATYLCLRETAALGVQAADPGAARRAVATRAGDTVVFDGRLDQRAELLASLATVPADISDASLVLHAYHRWGVEAARWLRGEFAFVIYAGRYSRGSAPHIYAARDGVGTRPLFYARHGGRCLWASELRQLLACSIPQAPNEGFIAECLAFDMRSTSETLFRDIQRLPPGHWMRVTAARAEIVRYWNPADAPDVRYRRDDEYGERFRELFAAAVADRAPAGARHAAFLSGGVDSSSVVCQALALGREVDTFSMVFPGTPEADESALINATIRYTGVRAHVQPVHPGGIDVTAIRHELATSPDLLDLPGDYVVAPLQSAIVARGYDAVLTGSGGDHGFTGRAPHPLDHLPRVARRLLRPMARRVGWSRAATPYVPSSFASRVALEERLRWPAAVSDMPLWRAHVYRAFASGWTAWMLETGDRGAAQRGLELRHPFFDRRLIEFAIGIPEDLRQRGETTKFVVREALKPVLPGGIYSRRGKADGSLFVLWGCEALGGASAIERLAISRLGWVDGDRLKQDYTRAVASCAAGQDPECGVLFAAWMALALDGWYRRVIGDGWSSEHGSAANKVKHGGTDRQQQQHGDCGESAGGGSGIERPAVQAAHV